jgi:hypothetical protein
VEAVALFLVKLAQMAADLPELCELDLNPILADEAGVIAVDARIKVTAAEKVRGPSGHPRFAVRPYPKEWERRTTLRDGTPVFLRPIHRRTNASTPRSLPSRAMKICVCAFSRRSKIAAMHSSPD